MEEISCQCLYIKFVMAWPNLHMRCDHVKQITSQIRVKDKRRLKQKPAQSLLLNLYQV